MAQNTREDIIACARRLFEERGYNGVSMRDIAGALDISVGNLTYHFKKKESLLEAILLSAGQTRQKLPPPQTLEELRQYFLHMLEVQQTYAFYFDSYHQLAQTSPTLARIQQELLGGVAADLQTALTHLRASGLLTPEAYPGQSPALVRTLTVLLMSRLPGEDRRTTGPAGVQTVLNSLQGVLYPLLTEAGKKSLDSLCPPV
ncbi:TetR/AcrR family transcriptional regulator [Evtepia sp.]|uniref:TetR/AcrR family transcriptional regulator n=1 Tax=Evtepia sp. TaxID=2773933 RepID=UPI002A82A5BD|nr:TetR/AcrR family transcriptional regulator [Evtepia sp.]MDY4431235.1 TetR/AcrR family transcriptional regulator [Evtepia sp.]